MNLYQPEHVQPKVDPNQVSSWLAAPTGEPGVSIAESLGVDEHFDIDSADVHVTLANLVAEADASGLLGLDEHRLMLLTIADDDGQVDGHLITIDLPDGVRLASALLSSDELLDSGLSGVEAAIGVLETTAALAGEVLTRYARADRLPLRPEPGNSVALAFPIAEFTGNPDRAAKPGPPWPPAGPGNPSRHR